MNIEYFLQKMRGLFYEKKLLSMLLVGVMASSLLVACGEKPDNQNVQKPSTETETDNSENKVEENYESAASVSDNWKDYEVLINGKKVKLPTSFKGIEQLTGMQLTEYFETNSQKPHASRNLPLMISDDQAGMHLYFQNSTEEELSYTECEIAGIVQTYINIENGATPIIFPGGLYVGMPMTEESLEEMFGTPFYTEEFESEEEDYRTWEYHYTDDEEDGFYHLYIIEVINGEISTLELRNLEYYQI